MEPEDHMLTLKVIRKSYPSGDGMLEVLKGINISFRKNEFTSILGTSGSGETTLLNIIGGLDHYDSGDLVIDGVSTKNYREKDWDACRSDPDPAQRCSQRHRRFHSFPHCRKEGSCGSPAC